MELKGYQQDALAALTRFLTTVPAKGPSRAFEAEVALQAEHARVEGKPQLDRTYEPLSDLPDVPYVCLRLPRR